jgi:hypothetical protein
MDSAGKAAFREHSHRARATAPVVYAVGILALVSLLALIKFPRQAAWIGWAILLGSAISIGLGIWTAEAGGRIRHSEFRSIKEISPDATPAPTSTAPSPSPAPTTLPAPAPLATPGSSIPPSPATTNGM